MDLMFTFADERVEGGLRGGRGTGGTDIALAPTGTFPFTLSSKSRKEISVDRVATISGTSELAV